MGMKCIQCGTDNNLKDRTDRVGRCKSCNHPFAFEPTTITDKRLQITDPFFAKAIADISADGTLFFTSKQLYYLLDKQLTARSASKGFQWLFPYIFLSVWAPGFIGTILSAFLGQSSYLIVLVGLNLIFINIFFRASNSDQLSYAIRRANAKNLQVLGVLILIFGGFSSLTSNSAPVYFLTVLLGMASIVLGIWQKKRQVTIAKVPLFEQAQVRTWLDRWTLINGAIPKLLPPPSEEQNAQLIDPDISAYSFDRAVVCDSAKIAQLLIANNFHFENNCAVLSITGYPQSIFTTVMTMLKRNPDLKVYALHDSTPQGMRLINQLKSSPNWFQNSPVQLIDLGLLPRQVLSARSMLVQSSDTSAQAAKRLPIEVRQALSADELIWLDQGNFVELESFSPQRLIRVINQGISQSQTLESDGTVVWLGAGTVGGYLYATDSFG